MMFWNKYRGSRWNLPGILKCGSNEHTIKQLDLQKSHLTQMLHTGYPWLDISAYGKNMMHCEDPVVHA